MDKITHHVRAEHWAKIMNECINSGMSKTAWCRENGTSEKQFFYWQRILRREAFENSQNSSLPAATGPDGWKRLPDDVYKRVRVQPTVYTVEEHHVAVYAGRDNQTILRLTVRKICCGIAS